jgi:arylsulfatase A-like enzyme
MRPRLAHVLSVAAAVVGITAVSAAEATAGARPNLLVIVTDDQRPGTMNVMPKARQWFATGATYPRAFATTPLCCPSRASIFSGQYAHNHDVLRNQGSPMLPANLQLQGHLDRAGYHTGLIGKFMLNWPIGTRPPSFDEYRVTNGGNWDTQWNVNGKITTIREYATDYIAANARSFIQRRDGANDAQPWFLYVATPAPHAPMEPAPKYANANVGPFKETPATQETDLSDKPPFLREMAADASWGPEMRTAVRRQQLRMLMSVDDMVGGIRSQLQASGEINNTLVIYLSDNGLLWGEHGGLVIKDLPYPQASLIPLFMTWPGHVPAGSIDNRLSANIDVAPTIIQAAGLPRPNSPPMDGRSLLDSRWQRNRMLLEYFGHETLLPPWSALLTANEMFTEYGPVGEHPGSREYYRLSSDPWQLNNLLGNANRGDDPTTGALHAQLAADRTCAGANCP